MAVTGVPSKGENMSGISSSFSNYSNKVVLAISLSNLLVTLALAGIVFVSFQRERSQTSLRDIAAGLERSQDGALGSEKSNQRGEVSASTSVERSKGSLNAEHSSEGKNSSFGKMLTLDQFTINLATVGGVSPKFVRVDVALEVPGVDSEAEVNAKMPQVRNVIIDLFNSKRSTDLSTVDGREALKEDIRNALNSFMMNGKITGVFFTSFAVSS